MTGTTEFTIGAAVNCSDGLCGEVSRVVVDPIARAVTHLVVEPEHRRGLGRLVSLDLVDATVGEVHLRCTLEGFEKLDIAEETQFLPGSVGYANYGPGQSLSWPHFGLGAGAVATDAGFGIGNLGEPVTFDKIPVGEVAVRVSVAASHHDEAFTACRWIIDQIKSRVPIWKRERYADGEQTWVEGETRR